MKHGQVNAQRRAVSAPAPKTLFVEAGVGKVLLSPPLQEFLGAPESFQNLVTFYEFLAARTPGVGAKELIGQHQLLCQRPVADRTRTLFVETAPGAFWHVVLREEEVEGSPTSQRVTWIERRSSELEHSGARDSGELLLPAPAEIRKMISELTVKKALNTNSAPPEKGGAEPMTKERSRVEIPDAIRDFIEKSGDPVVLQEVRRVARVRIKELFGGGPVKSFYDKRDPRDGKMYRYEIWWEKGKSHHKFVGPIEESGSESQPVRKKAAK